MIQESHVGIGILGKEGAHAAMSSDFVIQRFNHLRRLICVHGRNNYWRTSQVVLFSFYKNLAFPLPLFWYCYWSMANGTTSYDSLLIVRKTSTKNNNNASYCHGVTVVMYSSFVSLCSCSPFRLVSTHSLLPSHPSLLAYLIKTYRKTF